MTDISPKTLALIKSLQRRPFPVEVHGISMNPTLFEGDHVLVQRMDEYEIGDILVYDYGTEGLIIHRFIHLEHGLYHCRGDNTIRIERISPKRIMGKVLSFEDGSPVSDYPPNHWNPGEPADAHKPK